MIENWVHQTAVYLHR